MSISSRLVFFGLFIFVSLSILFFANANLGYFSNMTYLSAILLAEIVLASTWQYERTFFLLLMLSLAIVVSRVEKNGSSPSTQSVKNSLPFVTFSGHSTNLPKLKR